MGVIGHWRRSALGAGGVALLLPIGLALGVALTTALGGRDGLHALAQVFSGPSAPGQLAEQPGLEAARAVPPIPLPPRVVHHAAASATATPTAPHGSPSTPATTPNRTPTSPTGGGTPPARHPSGGGGSTPSSPPASSPPPPAQPQHSAAHNAGQQVADQVKTLPGPVGPAAGNAAQTVVDLIP